MILIKIIYSILLITTGIWIIKYRRIIKSWTWNFVWAEHYLWTWWTYLVLLIIWIWMIFLWTIYPFGWVSLIFSGN